jgi:hypothetical protein
MLVFIVLRQLKFEFAFVDSRHDKIGCQGTKNGWEFNKLIERVILSLQKLPAKI